MCIRDRYISCKTRRQTNKPLGMFFEKLGVYSRLGIKSVGKSLGDEIYEVIPACFVFYEKDKMGTSGVVLFFAVVHTATGDIHLAANNRLYPLSFAGSVSYTHL